MRRSRIVVVAAGVALVAAAALAATLGGMPPHGDSKAGRHRLGL